MKDCFKFFVLCTLLGCSLLSHANTCSYNIELIDKERGRKIPVAIYEDNREMDFPVVIINHGYGVKNTEYLFLAEALSHYGYYVVSIQHDMPGDPALAQTQNIFERRKPMWERGVQNIAFVMDELKKLEPNLNLNKIVLVGHSNGGDIAMRFFEQYPERVLKVISLDSLRYPFPVQKKVPILHFNATDTKPDSGVIPKQSVETISIADAKHMDFCDKGKLEVREAVWKSIVQFLK